MRALSGKEHKKGKKWDSTHLKNALMQMSQGQTEGRMPVQDTESPS